MDMFYLVFPTLLTVCLVWGYLYVSRVHKPLFQVSSSEPGAPPRATRPVIVLYDGICAFCDWFVMFCIANDPTCNILFAPLDSPEGQSLRAFYAIPPETDSLIAIHCGHAVTHSTAALVTLMSLEGVTAPLAAMLLIAVPAPVRDLGYSIFALLRYRLFGKTGAEPGTCARLTAATRLHFYTFPSAPSSGTAVAAAGAAAGAGESAGASNPCCGARTSPVLSPALAQSAFTFATASGASTSTSSSASSSVTASASSSFSPLPLHAASASAAAAAAASSSAAAAASAAKSAQTPSAPSPAALAALVPFLPPLLPPALPPLPEPQVTPDRSPPSMEPYVSGRRARGVRG